MDTSDYVAGGYIVTKFLDGTIPNSWLTKFSGATEDLIPNKILSIGMHYESKAPIFSWSSYEEDYQAFGVADEMRSELHHWAEERYESTIGHPNIFFTLQSARDYIQRFITVPDVQILGIGVHQQDLEAITELDSEYPAPNAIGFVSDYSTTGFSQAIRKREQYVAGEIVGFDVICCVLSIDHSWHCNHLAVDALREFNFRPNQFGLIDDKANADKLVDWIATPDCHAENGTWLAVLVSRYSLTGDAIPHQ